MSSRVRVKSKTGRIYVYEVESFWNKAKKKPDSHRKCIGHIDEVSGELVPNRPRSKAKQSLSTVKSSSTFTAEGIGNFALIDRTAVDTGLLECLKDVFPVEWPYIMTCCQYLCGSGNPLYRCERWSVHNTTYLDRPLSSQRISVLLTVLTPDRQREFFRAWIAHNGAKEYFALDITSVSSYSELIGLVKYGYNRDHEDLPQINLLMITGEKSHVPIYFLPLDGKIKDIKALKSAIADESMIASDRLSLIMDKGFYSAQNLDALYDSRMRFAVGVPFSSKIAKEAVEKNRNLIESHHNMISVLGNEVYGTTEPQKWKGHRLYTHVYFDSDKAAGERKEFHKKLCRAYEQLTHSQTPDDPEFARKYLIVTETPVRGRKVKYNEDEINKHLKGHVGWFVLVSNFIKDTTEALTIYREKDSVEKSFDDLKHQHDMKRLRVHSEEAMNGRLFLQFLSLILTVSIRKKLAEEDWSNRYSLRHIMDEIGELKQIKPASGKSRKKVVLATTPLQDQIIELFELSPSYV